MPTTSFVSPAYAYQYQQPHETERDFVYRLADELEQEIQRLGPENVISFIAEPVVGATSGCVPAPKGYFKAIRAICDRYDILLHLDEVMCGSGRCGTYFAFEQDSVKPDIVTIGKGLGGGYAPIAAMLLNDKVINAFRRGSSIFNNGHTYQAHPVTCATALAVQRIIKRDALVARCAVQGRKLEALLRREFGDSKYVGDIRGRGLFWALEFVQDRDKKAPLPKSLAFGVSIQQAAFELGVAIYPGSGTVDGQKGDHILLAPPYTVSDDELETAVTVLKAAYDRQVQMFESSRPASLQ